MYYYCVWIKWWPFYWYSQAKCHYLHNKIGATNFSEAEFAPSLVGCRPAKNFLLLAMALKLAWPRFISQFLECSHCLYIKPPSKLPNNNNSLLFQMALYFLSVLQQAPLLYYRWKHICVDFTWCARNANLTPWTMSSSSSGPPPTVSSSAETLFMYFMANFTDASLICHNMKFKFQKKINEIS